MQIRSTIQVNITGLDEVKTLVSGIDRQLPFAIAKSLTQTAKVAKAELVDEMGRVFDRPTPYTLSGLYIVPATKIKLESRVGIKDASAAGKGTPAINFLEPHIYGGKRREKRFERALRYRSLLPAGRIAVPAKGAPRDQYGNVKAAFIVQMLSYLQAFSEVGYTANITAVGKVKKMKKGLAYFAVTGAGKHRLGPGIYKRSSNIWGAPVEPVFRFVKSPAYQERYAFHDVAQRKADQVWRCIFNQAIDDTLRTAK